MRRILRVCFLMAATLPAWAGLPAAAQDILPGAFSGWTPTSTKKFSAASLEQVVGDKAALLREYGVAGAEWRSYKKTSPSASLGINAPAVVLGTGGTLEVTVYRMRDSTAAYGAFTFLRSEEMLAWDLSEHSAASATEGLAVVGNLLVQVTAKNVPALKDDLKALLAVLKVHAEEAPYPTLAQYLPEQGRIRNSERYVLGPAALNQLLPIGRGDWIGFSSGAEAQLARYRVNGKEVALLLVPYPTPQAAAKRLEGLRRWFNVDAAEEIVAGRPVVFARRRSSLLTLVACPEPGQLAAAEAESILGRIQYQSQVTWNEPAFKATERPWGETVYGIFVGTGAIMVFAMVAGLAFGGVRLVVKRLLPGKVFDRAESVEIIQLGLTSKPIEGKDFY